MAAEAAPSRSNVGLHPALARIKRNLPKVARSLGFDARVTSGYRSPAKQRWLYNRWLQGLQAYPVAPPGTSDHERGLALDVVSTDTGKLVALLTEVGLFWAGESDPVHFSLVSRRGEATAKSGATASWTSEVSSSIPSFLDYIPGLGSLTSIVRDPWGVVKERGEQLLTAILGPF